MTSLCLLECSICQQSLTKHSRLDDLSPNERSRYTDEDLRILHRSIWAPVVTPCGHLFHKGCITEWFRVRRNYDGGSPLRGTCPTCRKVIAYHKLIRLYLTPSPVDNETSSDGSSASTPVSSRASRTSLTSDNVRHNCLCLAHRSASQPSPSLAVGVAPSSINNFRIYSNFLELRYGRTQDMLRARQLASSHWNTWQGFLMEDNAAYEIYCENEDCRTLQTVYNVLVDEFRILQQKLKTEMDVSKMKSILVTSLQKESDKMKQEKETVSSKAAWFCLLIVCFLSCCYCLAKP
ncbi:putative RING finger protein P32A8.03c [Orchesella cincta]|uniref:RING-type E3 ubiquitin transferase n=1 Tax=Orchesella cincta TaxID=48709 RepID=A0A1D2NHE5_ORCCI|nr:putative RING finger protein P32A8.03c [Orchesella cincta]